MKIRHIIFTLINAICLSLIGIQHNQLTQNEQDIQTLATIIHSVVVANVMDVPPSEQNS